MKTEVVKEKERAKRRQRRLKKKGLKIIVNIFVFYFKLSVK
jgi:hypothetical protein